jgi:hypothetical protein
MRPEISLAYTRSSYTHPMSSGNAAILQDMLHDGGQGDLPPYGVLHAHALFWKVLCRTLSAFAAASSSPRNILELPGLANRCCSILCSCQRGSGHSVGLDKGTAIYFSTPPHVLPFWAQTGCLEAELQSF